MTGNVNLTLGPLSLLPKALGSPDRPTIPRQLGPKGRSDLRTNTPHRNHAARVALARNRLWCGSEAIFAIIGCQFRESPLPHEANDPVQTHFSSPVVRTASRRVSGFRPLKNSHWARSDGAIFRALDKHR
jgi:hypothetical protein